MLADRKHCCGCRACEEICNKRAITMQEDELGFIYPVINESVCVHCGRCEKVCPIISPVESVNETNEATAAIHKSDDVLERSASGGAFTAIYDAWKKKYPDTYVAGAVWSDDFSVRHEVVSSSEGISRLQKSKYIMSDTNGVFGRVKTLLIAGNAVLFSGTPCQVAALKNFLGKDYDCLLTVDLVCHGAPSAKIFRKHISEVVEAKGKAVCRYSFRNKKPINGRINGRSAEIVFEDGSSQLYLENEDAYMRAYYARVGYRESCSNCIYAKPERCSNITICDAHHIETLYPEIYSMQGVSCILYHSQKALKLKSDIQKEMTLYPVTAEWIVEHNEQLRCPTKTHLKNDVFVRSIKDGATFKECVDITLHRSFFDKVKSKVSKILAK